MGEDTVIFLTFHFVFFKLIEMISSRSFDFTQIREYYGMPVREREMSRAEIMYIEYTNE